MYIYIYIIYIPNDLLLCICHIGLFQKKDKQGMRIYFFEKKQKTLEFSSFLLYPWKCQAKQIFTPGHSGNLCLTPWLGESKVKIQPRRSIWKLHINSTSFLINPWKFHMLFLQYPWKFYILTLLFFFSGIAENYMMTVYEKIFKDAKLSMDYLLIQIGPMFHIFCGLEFLPFLFYLYIGNFVVSIL